MENVSTQRRAASSQNSFPPPPPLVYASLEPSVSAAAILYVSGVRSVWRAGICGGGGAGGVFCKLKPKKLETQFCGVGVGGGLSCETCTGWSGGDPYYARF